MNGNFNDYRKTIALQVIINIIHIKEIKISMRSYFYCVIVRN
jgi:hypothetical protein